MDREETKFICSFCGKNQDSVTRMVGSRGVFICEECLDHANHILGYSTNSQSEGNSHPQMMKI